MNVSRCVNNVEKKKKILFGRKFTIVQFRKKKEFIHPYVHLYIQNVPMCKYMCDLKKNSFGKKIGESWLQTIGEAQRPMKRKRNANDIPDSNDRRKR